MPKPLPARCDVAIIGGGIVGTSIAYHLGKIGITNTVVLERKQLTSGTTWHAAGLVDCPHGRAHGRTAARRFYGQEFWPGG
jgi:glycine/D-amino acid oxidase-like deaminating enzyme